MTDERPGWNARRLLLVALLGIALAIGAMGVLGANVDTLREMRTDVAP